MILGVDPGLATFGWAHVDEAGRPLALGLWTTTRDKDESNSTDRARRIAWLAKQVAGVLPGCALVIAEGMLFHGPSRAAIAQALAWGMLSGVALDIPIATVAAKDWQHAVMPEVDGAIVYSDLEKRLASHVERCGTRQARRQLKAIAPRMRTHALDAVGVGVYGAVAGTLRAVRAA